MSESLTYIASAPCGCVRVAVVFSGKPRIPAAIHEAATRGYTVRLLATSEVNTMSWKCGTPGCPFAAKGLRQPPFEFGEVSA